VREEKVQGKRGGKSCLPQVSVRATKDLTRDEHSGKKTDLSAFVSRKSLTCSIAVTKKEAVPGAAAKGGCWAVGKRVHQVAGRRRSINQIGHVGVREDGLAAARKQKPGKMKSRAASLGRLAQSQPPG